ncbi:MAG: shikimate dehydrogenase [Actinomycetaceae bacterium]|nr:shikimate dehydrogenase [Actinomycetaceae bacterium]
MRAFVIGQPIAHSLSPVLHEAAYEALGLGDWSFSRVEVAPEQLEEFVSSISSDVAGVAVTMPHKQQVMGLLDAIEPLAEGVGAVNTIVPAGKVLSGFNTDVHGIVKAISENAQVPKDARAVILGARATASSTLAALGQLHVGSIATVARSFAGPGSITFAETRLGLATEHVPWRDEERVVEELRSGDVIVSTLPTGVADYWAERFVPKSGSVILDVSYNPWPSKLAKLGMEAGAHVVSGYSMLLHQACLQVELMTGRSAPVEAMRGALKKATMLTNL